MLCILLLSFIRLQLRSVLSILADIQRRTVFLSRLNERT